MPKINKIVSTYSAHLTQPWLLVDSAKQHLKVMDNTEERANYTISTSRYGLGCQQDSNKTPAGAHKIAEKIGGEGEIYEIYKGRQSTGEVAEVIHTAQQSDEDLILSRIMWLEGLEDGQNCGQGVDSYQRYIYIHGTAEEGLLGVPASHGCVRMSNKDVIELYDLVSEGTFVYIK